jgi:VCBS repeat-containing protein
MPRFITHLLVMMALCTAQYALAQVNAFDDDFLVNENEVWTGNLGDNDLVPAGQTPTFSIVEGPSYGSFTFTNGGNFEYTPPLNQFGFGDSIYYQVCANNSCDIAGVEFYVIFRNTVPFAGNDNFSVEFNTARTGNVAANDGDPDSITDPIDTSLDWFKFTNPTNGIVNVFSVDGTFTYTPNTGFTGSDSFKYYVVDHCGLYATATVNLTVVGPNLNPTANDQTLSNLSEDVTYTGTLNALVSDPENDIITFSLISAPASGTLVLSSNGSYTFTPMANFTGNLSFTFSACDAVGQCDQGIVNLTINNVDNDPPQLNNDDKIINEDSPDTIDASTNDFDDTGTLTYTVFAQPSNGVAALVNSNGQFSYTPSANFFGTDSFVIQACDGVNCATSVVNVQINGINDAPTASPFAITTNEDSNISGSINTLADAEQNALTYTVPGGNTIAGLIINSNGTYNYIAPTNYFGTQTISIQGCDPQGLCATTTMTLVVNAVNDLPIASNDSFNTNEDITLSGNLSNGEYDIEGGSLTYSATQSATGGQLNLSPNGQFTYTPNTNWFGNEAITVNVCDSQNGCTPTSLSITVNSVNDSPTTVPASLTALEDNTLNGNLGNYASDVETAQMTYSVQTTASSGTFNLTPNGNFTFTPTNNFSGTVSASYLACDAANSCVSGLISINVASVNDAPIAANLNLNINEDQSASGVISGISDVDNSNLTITVTQGAQNGIFTLNNNAAYSYQPSANYVGSETISYTVCDPIGLCATGNIAIQIASVEDVPQVAGESYAVIQGNLLTGNAASNDSDGDADVLTYTAINSAQNGVLNFSSNGSFTYLPDIGFIGTESINYTVCDDTGNCGSATITIDVLTSNTAPFAAPASASINEDAVLNGNLLTSITDAEGGSFTFTTLSQPAHGTLQWLSNGNYVFTPDVNFNGEDTFIYRACDNGGLCAEAIVTISINPINDAPVAVVESITLNEDESFNQLIGAGSFDAEGDAINYEMIATASNGIAVLSITGVLNYTPAPNFWGIDEITIQLCDENNACTEAVLEISVLSINDMPIANSTNVGTQEDEQVSGNLSGFVSHNDEETLFFGTMIAPFSGTLVIQNTGEYTYSPNNNFFGNDQFTFLVCDPLGACDTASVYISISSTNDAPQTGNDALILNEDQPAEVNLAANDFEVENQSMFYELIGSSNLGEVNLTAAGNFSFVPQPNVFGSETLMVSVCDSQGTCSVSSLEITVNSVNDLPNVLEQAYSTEEDISLNATLLYMVSDIEESELNFTTTSNPSNGILELNSNGMFTYTPNENYYGTESLAYTVCDTDGGCSEGLLEIVITSINDSPQAQNTQITLSEDSATEGSFLDFTSDADNDALTISVLQPSEHGTFITTPDNGFIYAATANFFGLDSLQYSACDAAGVCDSATLIFEVTFLNDMPIINDEAVQILINSTYNGSVATNDVELDYEPLIYSIIDDNSGGMFTLQSDGSYTYVPTTDTTGLFTLQYEACDPCNACEYGTLSLYVVSEEEANTSPTAFNYQGQVCPGGSIAINLLNMIADAEETSQELNLSFGTANSGNYQLDAETQELVYQASAFASGQIVIPYFVCDNGVISMCDTAEIVLDILPVSPIEINGFQTQQITCFGTADGSISVEAQTTLGSVTYNWNNGSEVSSIGQLSPGIYTVEISSDAPCPINQTAQFEIFQPAELIGTYTFIDADGTNSTLGDSLQISISGGTLGYSISWITPEGTINNQESIEITANGNYSYTITDAHNCMYSENIVIAHVGEISSRVELNVFPNPIEGSESLQISCNTNVETLEIMDSKGALVLRKNALGYSTTMETASWPAGVYTLRISTQEGIIARRIVKQ